MLNDKSMIFQIQYTIIMFAFGEILPSLLFIKQA